jgi:hypothetical protein
LAAAAMKRANLATHSLLLYRPSARADDTLQRMCVAARDQGRRVTVLALAPEERPPRGCCDTRSVLWNRMCRELAGEHLTRAAGLVDHHPAVDFGVLVARVGRADEAVAGEALARGADEIVLADPRASGLGRLELRRLRRRSPVAVSAGVEP